MGLDSSSHPFLLFHVTCQPFGKHTGCLFGWLFSCRTMCCEERNRRQRARDVSACLLQPAGLSPRVAGPTVYLYILHLPEEPADPQFHQEVQPVLAVWVAGVCLDYLCASPHSSWHLCLRRLSWAVSPEGQLNCVLQMWPWGVQAPIATSVVP